MKRATKAPRKALLRFSVLAVACLAAFIGFLFGRPISASDVAKAGIRTLVSDDSAAFKFWDEAELRDLGVTRDQAKAAIEGYARPVFRSLRAVDQVTTVDFPTERGASASLPFVASHGKRQSIITTARSNPKGFYLEDYLTQSLVGAAVQMHPEMRSDDRRRWLADAISAEAGRLKALGVPGIHEKGKVIAWDELVRTLEESIRARPLVVNQAPSK